MGRSVLPMATRIAPILPVTDLAVALEHYRRLGFSVRAYPKGGYGFATLDQVETTSVRCCPARPRRQPRRTCSLTTPTN